MAERVFNPRQKKAIEHERGPMLVVAGAGTGKTTVLTERVARLIQRKVAKPGEIVALTYTIEAAAELRTRVETRLKQQAGDLQALNFHSYAYRLLDEHKRNFQLLDDCDLRVFLRQRLRDLPLDIFRKAADPARFLNDLTEFFSRCNDELVTAERYAQYVEEVKSGKVAPPRVSKSKEQDTLSDAEVIARCEEIAAVYRKVESMLAENNLGTFGMQITNAVELLRSQPAILAEERAKAKFILVDEFQDSNEALLEMVKLLAGDEQNVFAVGDPDQAIYHFRGASAAAFDSFRRAFPAVQHLALAENYRSLSPILGSAYRAIQKNAMVAAAPQLALVREPLQAAREAKARAKGEPLAPERVRVVVHDGGEQEAFHIARDIEEAVQAGAAYAHFCVLYRMALHREELVEELRRRGIPFIVEGLDALETTEVRDALAAMRALTSPSESAPLLRLCAQPEFGLDAPKLRDQLAAAKRDTTLYALLEQTAAGKRVLATIGEMNRLLPAPSTRASAYLAAVLKRFGFEAASKAMRTFAAFIAAWEEKPIAGGASVLEFLDYLDMFRDFGGAVPLPVGEPGERPMLAGPRVIGRKGAAASLRSPGIEDAVRLMTVHTAKGREFRHVYLIRVSQGSFPGNYHEVLFEFPRELRGDIAAERGSKQLHAEEERRLYYVAMTRAQDTLTLMGKKDWRTKKVPGLYLREMLETKEPGLPWEERPTRAFTADMAASAAPAISFVEPWLLLPPRPEMAAMPLSPSAIEAYETCPLKFKIRYDWRLPEEPTAALQYGGIMHKLLKEYFDQVNAGNTPADEQMLAQFRAELAQAKLEDPLQRELYERDGTQQLTDFLAARRADAGSFEVVSTEKQFKVEIAGVQVSGRIDRIDRMPDGAIRIVDYKTGKAKDQKDADKSLQLSIYALAAAKLDAKLTPNRLVLYNLVTNAPVVTKRTPEALQKATDKVRDVAAKIRAGDFAPDPGYHCKWCGYKDLCPATEERLVRIEKLVTAGGVQ